MNLGTEITNITEGKKSFSEVNELEKGKEGLVLLGAGPPYGDWINGITKLLFDEKISTTNQPDLLWRKYYLLVTTGGRHDLVMMFANPFPCNVGMLAMWRLIFGDNSWWSDYIVNYAKHHTGYDPKFEQESNEGEED